MSLRKDALADLYIFAKEVCGFRDLSPKIHGQVCAQITEELVVRKKHTAIVIPRDHFKSSLGVATAAWLFTKEAVEKENYEWRTMIDTATLTLSTKHLGFLQRLFAGSPVYRETFGDFYGTGKGFSNREIYVKQRSAPGIHKEPNFIASAIRAEVTGMHFDFHWYDDLTTERNWSTKHLRQIAISHFYNTLNLLDPHGIILLTATCWHDGDLVGNLRREEEEKKRNGEPAFIKIMVRAAMEDKDGNPDDEKGEAIFPERWSTELLLKKKASMPRYIWRAQMMNDPSVPEHAIPFNRETLYKPRKAFPQLKLITVTVDPNFRNEDQVAGDQAAIVVGGFDKNMNWFGLDVRLGAWSASDFIDQLFDVQQTWKPHLFRIEKNFTSFLDYSIKQEGAKRGRMLPIIWIKRDWRAKETRYTSLFSIFSSQRIFFAQEIAPNIKATMEEQLERVGTSKNDDFLDALADQFTDLWFGPSSLDDEPVKKTADLQGLSTLTGMMVRASDFEEDSWPEN